MQDNSTQPYLKRAEEVYPSVRQSPNPLKPELLISPYQLHISSEAYSLIEAFVKSIYRLSRTAEYQQKIQPEDSEILNFKASNDSVLMAYDFHLTEDGQPKLIEINTNASGFLISELICNSEGRASAWPNAVDDLISSFKKEWASITASPQVAIIDETLSDQKMLPEFYMYKDLFERQSWPTSVVDYQDLTWNGENLKHSDGRSFNCIYNRFNDFYLRRPQSADLRKAYFSNKTVFSPQPREYLLLADKQRLIEWSQQSFWQDIPRSPLDADLMEKVLLKSYIPSDFESLDALWSVRKKYFFKPLRMYGGKSAFKGANISRTAFNRIFADSGSMVQEICPAPKFTAPDGTDWKYDLRFFAYRDQIQLGVARLYQGQVTNFSTAGGGFGRIHIEDAK